MAIPSITEALPNHWKYLSEGGATIVFSYVGPPCNTYDGTVLRLRKTMDMQSAAIEDEPDDPIIEYQSKCMERLFPSENLPHLQSVRLDEAWLRELAQMQATQRPEARLDHIDFARKKGVLATDLVGGDWIAVEIKPKWAFLPSPTHLSEETKMVKTQTCRFCMHTYMRRLKNPKYVNNYCPLDLFSGVPERVNKALDDLWGAWVHSDGKVNNLRVFARGKVVKPKTISSLIHEEVTEEVSSEQIQKAFKDALFDTLNKSPVLHIISKLQRALDVLDIEGLAKLWRETEISSPLYQSTYSTYFKEPSAHERIPPTTPIGVSSAYLPAPEPSISDWVEFLDIFQSPETSIMDHTRPRIEHLRYYLLAYLLSATFKDCSLIVKMDLLRPGCPHHTVYPVAVIDLDPKSLNRMKKWEELDREIVSSYKPSKRKVCIET